MLQIVTLLKTWGFNYSAPLKTPPGEYCFLFSHYYERKTQGNPNEKESKWYPLSPSVLGSDGAPLMVLGTDMLHSSGLWTDTPGVEEGWDRDPPFLALHVSKPLVPTVSWDTSQILQKQQASIQWWAHRNAEPCQKMVQSQGPPMPSDPDASHLASKQWPCFS